MRRLSALFILTLLLVSTLAGAGAKEHFINGREYYDQGRYKDAIEEFEKAYQLDQQPLLLYNIAQAHEKLGNLPKSVEYLERFLKENTKMEDTTSVKNKIANLKARIHETGITINCSEASADIYVDDIKVGVTPALDVIPLEEGMHSVRLAKTGFKDFMMNIGVSTGYTVPVDATLEPGQGSVLPTTPPPADAGAEPEKRVTPMKTPPAEAVPPESPDTTVSDERMVTALDIAPWVIAGVGAAAAIAGLGIVGGMAVAQEDHDKAVVADIVGWPGVGLAATGLVWGIVDVIVKKKRGAAADRASLFVMPLVCSESAGLTTSVHF